MKRWKCRILLCLIFLAGGAVTTVAVAWVCQLWKPLADLSTGNEDLARMDRYQRWWHRHAPGSWSDQAGTVISMEFLGLTRDVYFEHSLDQAEFPSEFRSIDRARAGWPVRALDGWYCRGERADGTLVEHQVSGLLSVNAPLIPHDVVPLLPIWHGFLIDTFFYGATWCGVFFGFASAKRAIRRKRGRCPMCGYDLRGQAPEVRDQESEISGAQSGCPECGWNRHGSPKG